MLEPLAPKVRCDLSASLKNIAEKHVPTKLKPIVAHVNTLFDPSQARTESLVCALPSQGWDFSDLSCTVSGLAWAELGLSELKRCSLMPAMEPPHPSYKPSQVFTGPSQI